MLGVSPMLGRALTPDEDRATAKVARAELRSLDARLRPRPVDRRPRDHARSPTVYGHRHHAGTVRVSAARLREQRASLPRSSCRSRSRRSSAARSAACTTTRVIARLKPGVSVEQARGELGSLANDDRRAIPAGHARVDAAAVAADVAVRGRHRRPQPPDAAGADGRRRHRAAHRLCGRGEPDADACRLAPARAGGPVGARRQPGPRGAPAAHRRPPARGDRRRGRRAARVLDDAGAAGVCRRHPAARRIDWIRRAGRRVRASSSR